MQVLQLIHSRPEKKPQAYRKSSNRLMERPRSNKPQSVDELPKLISSGIVWEDPRWLAGRREFFNGQSIKTRRDFELISTHFHCPGSTILIREEQIPSSVLLVVDGKVKLSMNSFDGRRFLLGVAGPGEMVGLASAVSGDPSGIMAETLYPCTIAAIDRQDFLDFLLRNPLVSQNVSRELTVHYAQACESLRIIGLMSSIKARLARLVLKWCVGAPQTIHGAEIRCILTHEEIGECIGTSRESVTRALAFFKDHDLVKLRGSVLIVPSRAALAFYARVESMPDPPEPAA
jgi:CRP/FNR family transcriptional regulator, cyclic AMP receptor protein